MSVYVRKVKQLPKSMAARLGSLDIELTERCNNNCIHCCINLPADDRVAAEREMTTHQLQELLTEAADLGCLEVRFTGGEPLLRPDFAELYLFARRLGLKVLVFTNATLLTEELAGLFASVPPLVPSEVTVYGMHKESYEAVTRRPGSFARFRRGVDLLLERRVPFALKGALLPPNRHEINELEAWVKTLPCSDTPPSYSMFFDLRNRCDDPQKNALIKTLRVTPQEGLAVLTRDVERYRKEIQEFAGKFMGPPSQRLFTCGAGRGLCVDAYGRAQPCMGVRIPALCPDLFALNGPNRLATALEQMAALSSMRSTNPAYLERCARCFLKGLCQQCPAKSWAEHGNLDTPVEYFCEVAHAQARFLGWLGADERAWQVADWRERIRRSA
jgi:radical SAM protein with 4Fe4S-binding SPASM domain